MKSNKLIYIAIFSALFFFSILYVSTGDDTNEKKVQQHSPILEPAEIDTQTGDSTADSYTALQETIKTGIKKNEVVENDNQKLRKQLKILSKQFEQFKNEQKFIVEQNTKKAEGLLKKQPMAKAEIGLEKKEKLKKDLSLYTPKPITKSSPNDFDFSNKFSLPNGLVFPKTPKILRSASSKKTGKNGAVDGWIMPIELELSESTVPANGAKKVNKEKKPTNYPAMTISDNAVLYDTTALTYLVGRIPVGGRVVDPFPVKLVVGNEILIANGHDLPGIEGMFFSGYATGDMNLNCVRAKMNSYTFVFDDGRQVTYRESPNTGEASQEPMAYISDRFGLPCVMGTFVSNVSEFLSIQAGLSGLTAAGEAYAAAQVTTGGGLTGSQSTVTGSSGKFALGSVISESFSNVSEWMLARQENSFDAVVVPSGTLVSLHLNRDILLDYKEAARRVDYRYQVNNSHLD